MAPGLPLGVLEALHMPMLPLFASSAPSVSAFAISAPDGYAARPSPWSRLRPSSPSMTLLGAYRVLSCWPAATRAVGTSQTSGQQPMCAHGMPLAARCHVPRAIVPTFDCFVLL